MNTEGKNDPDHYRKMSVPFENADAANEALRGFYEEVSELRKKHRITDVSVVVSVEVKYPDGGEGMAQSTLHLGDSLKREGMLAYAFGQAQAENREMINKLLAGKKTR